ncbi:MAG: hypothetical protein PHE89_00980 [Alphaproteobacteria bacterium]|nr:hypothetical protein [Alphaproteobacteria bacterium]
MVEVKKRRPRIGEGKVSLSSDVSSVDKRINQAREKLYGKKSAEAQGKRSDAVRSLSMKIAAKNASPLTENFQAGGDVHSISSVKSVYVAEALVKKCFANLDKWREEVKESQAKEKALWEKQKASLFTN